MQITVKLFAHLSQYLPAGARENQASLEVAEDATPAAVLAALGVPAEQCHLVLINGVFVAPDQRASRPLRGGDALAVWPPVAGG